MKILYTLVIFFLVNLNIVHAQSIVKGYVISEDKEPLIGATILIPGTSTGTISNVNGEFTLNTAGDQDKIEVSYVGFATSTFDIIDGIMEIVLKSDVSELDAVVVSGFVGAVGQARRRAESIQSIPESVYNLSSDQLEISGVNNIQSFATLVPNMSFQTSQNIGVNFINVRGIAQIRNGESPVAFVIDGVNIPDPNLVNQELHDIAMVEVVKGPQGTLYGKNAIGGAINILTQSPTNYSKSRLLVGYGNGNSLKFQGATSGAITPDKVYYRLSGSYKKSDGLIDNVTLGEPVDFFEELSVRGQLKFDISSRLVATAGFQYADTEGGAVYFSHNASGLQLDANDFDNNIVDADQRGESTLDNSFGFLKVEYNFGKSVFRSVTSLNNANRNHFGDLDFLSSDILRQFQDSNSKTFNQEFRISSSASSQSKVTWDFGAFYQSSERTLFTDVTADFGFFAMPAAPTGEHALFARLTDFTQTFNTIALFGFVDFKISDAFTASFGLRFDSDDISSDNRLLDINPEKNQSELQPKISLSYQASEQLLIYGNYGRGYRSGGFNSDATDLFDDEYGGETSDNFEIGLKTSSKDNRMIFNAAAFYVDFTDQQQYAVAIGTTGLVLGNYNLPQTTVSGVEADLKYRTSKYLDIIAGLGFNSSKIDEAGDAGTIDRSGFVGNTTPYVPATTWNIALQSDFPISDNIDFNGFINLNHKGEIFWHENNIDSADPFSLLDLRLGLTFNKNFGISLWANNLLDTEYYQEYLPGEISGSAAGDIAWIGKPRTIGVDLSVKF